MLAEFSSFPRRRESTETPGTVMDPRLRGDDVVIDFKFDEAGRVTF